MKNGLSCSCGHGCDCGCCEGTEPLTPQKVANRPGLDALAYRIGTHSSFLETMKARLSSTDHPALRLLTTRDESDPAIALLDAWAVVADVLTFYQERIANEGYLRTATERRSVLELARLVGYAPRPGVAASTWLAYLLDPGPETVIRAGSGARSVPGPGEMPQTFETSEDLTARAAWNNLQVRLTRPQQTQVLAGATAGPVSLYLKGIATQIKPNDPLLIDIGGATPDLYRVLTVEPDAAKDRTRAAVELWWKEASTSVSSQAISPGPVSVEPLREVVERARNLEAQGISRGAMAQRVVSHLDPLKAALDEGAGEPELRAGVEGVLSKLREEHQTAEKIGARRVGPWIARLTAELEGALAVSENVVVVQESVSGSPPADQTKRTTALSNILETLGRKPEPQLASSRQLDRNVGELFGPDSDLGAKLLIAARPELRNVLYQAWANVPVAPPPVLKVCALRTRASVFGHNAPLELVRRPRDGVILRSKEWDLRPPAEGPGERISISLSKPSPPAGDLDVVLGLQIGNLARVKSTLEFQSGDSEQILDYLNGEETVYVTLKNVLTSSPGNLPSLEFFFENRDVRVELIGVSAGLDEENFEEKSSPLGTRSVQVQRLKTPISDLSGETRQVVMEEQIGHEAGELEPTNVLFLDNSYSQIKPGDWIVLERPDTNLADTPLVIAQALTVKDISRAAYGFSGKSTRVELGMKDGATVKSKPWLQFDNRHPDTFAAIRGTAVFAQCEELILAEEPITDPLCGGTIELAALYDGLQPGRLLIVAGERTDVGGLDNEERNVIVPVPGVPAAEIVMLAGVRQEAQDRPGEYTHTTLTLAKPLAYCYRRDTVRIFGNVAPATHGETRFEVLGSGDGSKSLQSFTLKQPPLTYVSAPTPSGIESTLKVRVNDVLWREADSLAGLGPTDRSYVLRTDDEGKTTVIFGNGKRGARLPTGIENVRAAYRNGIGRPGNVKAGQITQPFDKPLGVKDVINPLPATGGADRESRDQARRHAPLALFALDRLISVQDYEDFTRTFAGIGKASAAALSDGRVRLVHITLAGEDDIPILEDSDLFRNLEEALRRFGDPRQPLRLELREASFLVLQADVRVLPEYQWEKVEPKIRAALLDAFSFARRDLGQDALLSEAYQTIQGVRGVDFVDVNVFGTVTASVDPKEVKEQVEKLTDGPQKRLPAHLARNEDKTKRILPAQLIYFTPEVPDTLILKERKS